MHNEQKQAASRFSAGFNDEHLRQLHQLVEQQGQERIRRLQQQQQQQQQQEATAEESSSSAGEAEVGERASISVIDECTPSTRKKRSASKATQNAFQVGATSDIT